MTTQNTVSSAVVVFNGISGQALCNRKGKVTGSRMLFAGELTASEVRESLKAAGKKGNELKKAVNEVLTGKQDVAWAKHDAAISLLRSGGYIPDYVDARKSGATARFVKPAELTKKAQEAVTREAALAALGLTNEQFAALSALMPKA